MELKQRIGASRFGRLAPHGWGVVAAVALVVLFVGTVELFVGAITTGISVDEPNHILRTQTWIDHGWYLAVFHPDADGQPISGPVMPNYAYGPAFSAIAHLANVIAGNEPTDRISVAGDAWAVRHLVTAMVGLATSLVAGLGVWALTGSRRFAVWGAAALLAIPIWTGMSFFNPKDVPAAAGYTFLTVGLVLALNRDWRPRIPWVRVAAIGGLVAAGVYLGVGTRLALWLPLSLSLVTYAILAWISSRSEPGQVRVGALSAAGGAAIGLLALVLAYQSAFSDPLALFSQSLTDSSNYPYTGVTLTAGQLLSEHPPWWYLPLWGFASAPVLIFLVAVSGGAGTLWSMVGSMGKAGTTKIEALAGRRDLPLILVLQQALLISVGSIVVNSVMYTGLRQHLYVMPALALLAGVGAFRAWTRWGQGPGASKYSRVLLATVLSATLLIPVAEGILLFPFNYTYINPIAGLGGINDRWETDYWGTSSREALRKVPADQLSLCAGQLVPRDQPKAGFTTTQCAHEPQIRPYLTDGQKSGTIDIDDSVWIIARQRAGSTVPDDCDGKERDVTRWVRGEDVVMSHVLQCDVQD